MRAEQRNDLLHLGGISRPDGLILHYGRNLLETEARSTRGRLHRPVQKMSSFQRLAATGALSELFHG